MIRRLWKWYRRTVVVTVTGACMVLAGLMTILALPASN